MIRQLFPLAAGEAGDRFPLPAFFRADGRIEEAMASPTRLKQ